MTSNSVVGEWGNFVFKMIQPADHPRILQHLKDCLYYRAFYRIGYTKDLDVEMDAIFQLVLNDGYNLSFFAEDKATGKVAGCRIITMEKAERPDFPVAGRLCKGIVKFYYDIVDDCKLKDRYDFTEFPHMFGISVEEEFCRQGLATEIYRRAIGLMKERGFSWSLVAFISPYSRAAAGRNGFIQLAKRNLTQAVDEDGSALYAEADPNDFLDVGVFESN